VTVQLTIVEGGLFGPVIANYFTMTNAAGQYSIPWDGFLPPNSFTVRVLAMRPQSGFTVVRNLPLPVHSVVTGTVSPVLLSLGTANLGASTGLVTVNLTMPPSETAAVHRTTSETFRMWSAEGALAFGLNLNFIQVFAFVSPLPAGSASGGISPGNGLAFVAPDVGTQNPRVVAHELGHVLAWDAFGVVLPIIQASDFGACDGVAVPAWNDLSDECERVAFQEGFAIFNSMLWLWNRNAPASASIRSNTGGRSELESTSQSPIANLFSCSGPVQKHRRALCNARALWDIVDNRLPDDDPIFNRTLGDIVRVFIDYPNNCTANRCVDESDVNGVNWKDFRFHYLNRFPSDVARINVIEMNLGLVFSDNN
jgi:hypothetical protein